MNSYKVLNKQSYSSGIYSLVPIRSEDRYSIMKWRNEQIYHLRQNTPLTAEDQDTYFQTVIAQLFNKEQPDQILFSYLENGTCIGYGGLVHINWLDENAEISFVLNTALEETSFEMHWQSFLAMIELIAFTDLNFHKIYTYAFDLRPKLYLALTNMGFTEEARLKEHCCLERRYLDVLIHSKINEKC